MKKYLDEMEIDAVVDLFIDRKAMNILVLSEMLAAGKSQDILDSYQKWVTGNNEWMDGIKNKIITMNNEMRMVEANESAN